MSTVRQVYAFRNTKDIYDISSSGGAYIAICDALYTKYRDVIVYGAKFDENLRVVHSKVTTRLECEQFCGSKYIASDFTGVLQDVEQELRMNKIVLFTGTPCQVYALRHYCDSRGIDIRGLYLVDIICHGTGEPKVWRKYKEWLEKKYNSRIIRFDFRYKKSKWKSYPVRVVFENGKELINSHNARLYTNMFLSRLIMRDCCYQCKYSNLDRISDLTIGDFWGISKVMPDFPKDHFTSEILVNTKKGEDIMQSISHFPDVSVSECFSDSYIKYQHNLNQPTVKNERVSQFKVDMDRLSFDDILKIYAGNNVKGKMVYWLKRLLAESGLTDLVKRILRK